MSRLLTKPGSRGFAFAAVLMVMLVLAILIAGVLAMAVSARNLTASRQEYAAALYSAEAGINKLISDWRAAGVSNPPGQPFQGALANGDYHVQWAPDPDRPDLLIVTSRGTVNSSLSGTILNLSRTVRVKLDSDGDWAWNHVYYSDSDNPEMVPPLYADINGNGNLEIDINGDDIPEAGLPEDFVGHVNGPMGGAVLPSPMWDIWHEWVRRDLMYDPASKQAIPRDPDGDGVADPRWPDQATLPAYADTAVTADPARHMYWYGSSTTTPVGYAAHAADSHATYDINSFMPDWYGVSNPDAYVCNSSSKRFTVTFGSKTETGGVYTCNYFVHGDIHVKNKASIHGTLVATGDVIFYGVEDVGIVPEPVNPNAPCDERVYYPAIIAGGNVLVRDQGANPGDPDAERLRVSGVIWAGSTYTGQASNVQGCIVSPDVTLGGNFVARYGANIDGCYYEPGENPPPWFREPDRGEMQPVPRSWREL